jgi:hypothetical protein
VAGVRLPLSDYVLYYDRFGQIQFNLATNHISSKHILCQIVLSYDEAYEMSIALKSLGSSLAWMIYRDEHGYWIGPQR